MLRFINYIKTWIPNISFITITVKFFKINLPCFQSQPSLSGLKKVCIKSFPSSSGILKGSCLMLSYKPWMHTKTYVNVAQNNEQLF